MNTNTMTATIEEAKEFLANLLVDSLLDKQGLSPAILLARDLRVLQRCSHFPSNESMFVDIRATMKNDYDVNLTRD